MAEVAAPPILRPDDLLHSRLGRLVLLLAEAPSQPYRKPMDIERVGAYDFFADNPFLLFGAEAPEHRELLLAGFDPETFSYHSSSQRFTNRRGRMQHDLAHLLSLVLVTPAVDGGRVAYALTAEGEQLAEQFCSSYARSFRTSARLVVRTLNRLAHGALQNRIAAVLEEPPFVIDLYRGLEAEPPPSFPELPIAGEPE